MRVAAWLVLLLLLLSVASLLLLQLFGAHNAVAPL